MTKFLTIMALAGSGTVAGVMFAVALSVVPAMFALSPSQYVEFHKLLGRNWDPTMPFIVLATCAVDIALAITAPTETGREAHAVAAFFLFGVSVVSHLCNVPINRRVKSLDPEAIPADWADPRTWWRRWHLVRTALAFAALLVSSAL
jgi:uncharacterized membrane protein